VVEELNPPLEKDTAPGPVVPTWVHGPDALGPRSILKPVSLNELSVQDRLIWLALTATAPRLPGATGIDWGVAADATFENEVPAELNAPTR
jgi:hypothetical protein